MYKRNPFPQKIVIKERISSYQDDFTLNNEQRDKLKKFRDYLNRDIITNASVPSLNDLKDEINGILNVLNAHYDRLLLRDKKLIAKFSVALDLWAINEDRKKFLCGTDKMKKIVDEYIEILNIKD